jgi:hypothetical protein
MPDYPWLARQNPVLGLFTKALSEGKKARFTIGMKMIPRKLQSHILNLEDRWQ